MEITIQNYEKFKYVVIENFFDLNDFNEIAKIELEPIELNEIKVYDLIKQDFKEYLIKKYEHKLISILKKLAPNKTNLKRKFDIRLAQTGSYASYPVHQDHPNKILSVVIYISPEFSTGTLLHLTEKDNDPKEIEWKSNKAFIFSRHPFNTWHSYIGDKKSIRRTIVYNVYTDNITRHELIDHGYIGFAFEKLKQLKNIIFKF